MTTRRPQIRKKAEGSYHHGDLKTSLKRAALRLVRTKGPRGFSLNEASRLAGVTVAAPYRHFADKDALLAELACDGNRLMTEEIQAAVQTVTGVRQQMLEAGLAYLRFSRTHADYFAVLFDAGLDKSQYPELEETSAAAFGTILTLAQKAERTAELAGQRAVAAWALVHGLATLSREGALSLAVPDSSDIEAMRPLLRQFLNQPLR